MQSEKAQLSFKHIQRGKQQKKPTKIQIMGLEINKYVVRVSIHLVLSKYIAITTRNMAFLMKSFTTLKTLTATDISLKLRGRNSFY